MVGFLVIVDLVVWLAVIGGYTEGLVFCIPMTLMLLVAGSIIFRDHNYTPPEGYKTDWEAMGRDRRNGANEGTLMRNRISGKYNIPKDIPKE